nr:PREDICTED: TBC1 domain family member 19 isoform X2 [Latimeria chalumnae]|eukprot:XP_014347960.1 PREDICTED: TBC1 domain family member 19 isoform X2 [Latimeria chalumnae]
MLDEETGVSVRIAEIIQKLQGSGLPSHLEQQARKCLHRTDIRLESLKEDVKEFLKKTGWEKKLQNAVYRELNVLPPPGHPAAPPEHLKEPLTYMRKAQRPIDEQRELLSKWNEMGTDEPDLSRFRPVYAPKDFLEVLINLRNPNYDTNDQLGFKSHLGLIQVPLHVKDLLELSSFAAMSVFLPQSHRRVYTKEWKLCQEKEAFAELSLNIGQLGIDDATHVFSVEVFESEHVRIGKKVLAEQDSAAAQQYIRQGCPTGLRADLWALILNVTNHPEATLYYEQLKSNVIQHDLLVDSLIYKDVKLTASNDDYYFVFEDYLYQVLLCFSRDTSVLEHFTYNSASPPKSYIRGKLGNEEYAVVYPPNGMIPFHGFSMYVAPLCFLYHEPSKLYQVFHEMYVRYFFRLHSISSHSSGIVSLCLLFETLLQTHLPQLFCHLREIGAQALRISFKWMVRAFSGYLATDQLLLLWDRILGYNSLEILSVLAAAVFAFRAENLMEVTSLAAAEAVLADLSTLKVMPLLQIFLFATVT